MTNNPEIEAKMLRNSYQQSIKEKNVPLSITLKQEFYQKGFNKILDIEKQTQEASTNE